MATIVYLDAEDEITSAATRIRTAGESRVALVLPFGSRLATSRINFRLLAREAMTNGRRLDVIAPDASARALAASAGLPVFASIGEYEEALAAPDDDPKPGGTPLIAGGLPPVVTGPADAHPGDAAAGLRTHAPVQGPGDFGDGTVAHDEPVDRRRAEPRTARAPRRAVGRRTVGALVLLVLVLAASGVAAFVFLPAADIVVTPRIEPIGPISLAVRADPAATAVDAASAVIPAQILDLPTKSSGEFRATGKRVADTKALGGVRWTNCDPTASYTIPKGSVVRTSGGVGFTTDEAVFLPVAALSGTPPNVKVACTTSQVAVTAMNAGPAGNVASGAIKVVAARYNRTVISVTNPAATTGGTHQEFPKVQQVDVDAAVVQLRKDLEAQFATALADPATAPAGTTLFPATATLGAPVTDVDPATLVGQEVKSFKIAMSASGQVLAVDASPVKAIAEARLQGSIGAGYQLVARSIDVTVGEGTVVGGVVTFPVEGSARQVRTLDATVLKAKVLGLAKQQATDLLASYGEVRISLWPDWVSSVPSMEQRVTVALGTPLDVTPAPTAAPGPTGTPFAGPSGPASGDAPASEPVPSG